MLDMGELGKVSEFDLDGFLAGSGGQSGPVLTD